MKEKDDPRLTILLEDDPARNDQFGGHDRVADAIVDTILDQPGGKVLSIQGTWGSGKSTVIQFIEDKLDNSNSDLNFNIFCFDSWIHEQDPLRRAFLEELIDFLNSKGLLSKEIKKEKKNILSKRVKEEKTRTIPELTTEGKIISLASILVPIGLVLFSQSIGDGEVKKESWWWWGLCLSLSPLFVGIFIFISKKLFKLESQSFNVLLTNQTVTNLTKTYESPEPSTIEFEVHFEEILKESLSKVKDRLIIVIDNLDRLDADHALKIWSTIRVFFELRKTEYKDKIWLLVPFDHNQLEQVYQNDDRGELTNSFIEKTFHTTYRISPPILSGWRGYFVEKLEKAFPNQNQKEYHRLYRVFNRYRINKQIQVTPRQLIKFINKVGSINRQWGDSIGDSPILRETTI